MASLSNNKRKGAAFEQAVADYLAHQFDQPVERRHLAGIHDRGDIAGFTVGGQRVVVECKNTTKLELSAHLAEAERERENDEAAVGLLVQKRRGVGFDSDEKVGKHFVVMNLDTFVELLKIASKQNQTEGKSNA